MKKLAFATSVAILTMFVGASAFAQSPNRHTTTPLATDNDGRFVVNARINGRGPYVLAVDTAATRTALFDRVCVALGVEKDDIDTATVITPFGSETLPVTLPVDLETAGGRSMANLQAVVLPDWGPDVGLDGFLGLDFLSSYFVLFNLEDGLFEVYDRNPGVLPSDWASTAIKDETFGDISEPLYWTYIKLGRRRFYTILDTGSISTIINWPAAQRVGLDPNSPDFADGTMEDALGIERPVVGIRFRRTYVGRRLWRNQVVLVADMKIFEIFERENRPTGILGLDLMRQQNFAVDFPGKRLHIAPLSYRLRGGNSGRQAEQ